MGNQLNGEVSIYESGTSRDIIRLDADKATISIGGSGTGLQPVSGPPGKAGSVSVVEPDGKTGVMLYAATNGGAISLYDEREKQYAYLGNHLAIGGNGADGYVALFAGSSPQPAEPPLASIHLRAQDGVIRAGGAGVDGSVLVLGKDNSARVTLQGSSGDILLANADLAEDFDLAEEVEPGMVVVLDDQGRLCQCRNPYDKRVAGVISGAGGYKPAIVLDNRVFSERRMPIALAGKVCCKVDADCGGGIETGDLLTTAPTPGHAMKAHDPLRSFGAVLGKALRPLTCGRGLVPILVGLQ